MIRTEKGETYIGVRTIPTEELQGKALEFVTELNAMKEKIEITADISCILGSLIKRYGKYKAVEMWAQACKNIDELNKREKENNKDE